MPRNTHAKEQKPTDLRVPPGDFSFHRLLDARSLALHPVIGCKIERNPTLLQVARRKVARWTKQRGSDVPHWLVEWRQILARPWPEIAAVLTEQSENAIRLRQSTPFAGVLSSAERKRIREAFEI